MSGYVCPHCSECSLIFSQGGGESFAVEENIPFLGRIPLDPELIKCTEDGRSFVEAFPNSSTLNAVNDIVKKLNETSEDK